METATADLVTDPLLHSVLESAAEARRQSLEILNLLSEYHSRPSPPEETDLLSLSKQQKKLQAQLSILRGLNRKAILGVRSTKQETSEARQEIDTLHLQLQNLYYEQRHLRGEIQACHDYNHTYEEINMVSVEDFLERKPEFGDASEHDLTIARIEDEHAERVRLESMKKVYEEEKRAITTTVAASREALAKLDTAAEKWLTDAGTVRTILEEHEKAVKAEDEADEEDEDNRGRQSGEE